MEILLAMEVPPEVEVLLPREAPPMMKVLLEMVVLPVWEVLLELVTDILVGRSVLDGGVRNQG